MEYSVNFGFNLPSSDADDIADINKISDNFRIIDENIPADTAEKIGMIDEALGEIIEIQEGFISSLPSAEGMSF